MIQHLRWNFSNDFTITVIKSFMALFNCIYLLNVLSLLKSVGGRADSKAYHDFAAPRTSSWRHFSHAFSSLSPVREAVLFQDPQWELLRHYVSSCIIHQAGLQHFSKTSGHPLALFPTTKHWSASLFRDYERRNGEGLPSLPHQGLSEFSLREEPTTCGLTD